MVESQPWGINLHNHNPLVRGMTGMTNINDINMGELIDKTRDTPKDGISVPGLPGWELHVPDDVEVDLNPNESITGGRKSTDTT